MDVNKSALDSTNKVESNLICETAFFDAPPEPFFHTTGIISEVISSTSDCEKLKISDASQKMRQDVLESIYSIATSSDSTTKNIYNKIVVTIAQLLNVPFVSIVKKINIDKISSITRFNSGLCDCNEFQKVICKQCAIVFNSRKPLISSNDELHSIKLCCDCLQNIKVHSYLGVPIVSSSGEYVGTICIVDTQPHEFTSQQIHVVEIFSRYVANEFDRESIQKELLQSQEMKLLGVLTSGVAHEVRNPLNAIWAITEALFQEIKSDTTLNIYKDHIKIQVERLSSLMQELLDLGKPFSFKDASIFSLPLLCRKTIDLWTQTDNTKRTVQFVNNSPDNDGLIKGNYNKIQQVIVNLLDNAHQHSPSDNPIRVCFYQLGSLCHIDVIDQGTGISKDIHARIFIPFFTTRAKGTGLGLPIVKNILDIHGGTIELINNNPPPGTTASICLPAATQQDVIEQSST